MTTKEQYIIDNIDRITVQVRYPYRVSGFREIWFAIDHDKNEDINLFSHLAAARLYNKKIIIHKKTISGDSVMMGTHTLQINPNLNKIEMEEVRAEMNRPEINKFKEGDKVCKPKGYAFDGIVVAVFKNTSGEIRIVAELENNGMLHIFTEGQLEHLTTSPNQIEVTDKELEWLCFGIYADFCKKLTLL
jgi:hypothetical protein